MPSSSSSSKPSSTSSNAPAGDCSRQLEKFTRQQGGHFITRHGVGCLRRCAEEVVAMLETALPATYSDELGEMRAVALVR